MLLVPIGDDNSARRRFPFVTIALIAANAVAFYLELMGGEAFILRWAFVPARFAEDPTGEAATLLTAMFMHGGWMHLAGNMLYLWVFGDNVEDRFGRFRFLLFYLVAGFVATFSQYAIDPASAIPNVGASGAISGVLGAYLLLFPKMRVHILLGQQVAPVPAFVALGSWFAMQLVSGFGAIAATGQTEEGGIAYAAHVGGFIAGLLLAGAMGGLRLGGDVSRR
jgi:membrane associated rhomboid family serine protease